MATRNKACDAAVYGVDIGKTAFPLVGADAAGQPVHKGRYRRDTLLQFLERATPAIVGMEACPGAHWLARKIAAMGHKVRIVPAQFVKPYVKSNKNDIIDAAAIAEAVTRPTMRFEEAKSPEQVDLQALHRVRERMVTARTRLICQMRGFCLEHGVAMRQGVGAFKLDLAAAMADENNDLTPAIRRLLGELRDDLLQLETRIAAVSREIEAVAARTRVLRVLVRLLVRALATSLIRSGVIVSMPNPNHDTPTPRQEVDSAPLTIFIVLPSHMLSSYGRLLRLWIGTLLAAITRRRSRPAKPTLFILDEAAQLGELEELRLAVTLLRDYGLQTWGFGRM